MSERTGESMAPDLREALRAFRTGGNIVTCHKSVLKPEIVDGLVFLAVMRLGE